MRRALVLSGLLLVSTLEEAEDDDFLEDATERTRQRVRKAAAEGYTWVRWDDAGIHFTFPVENADKRKLKQSMFEHVAKESDSLPLPLDLKVDPAALEREFRLE